jgi:hypothetical protein
VRDRSGRCPHRRRPARRLPRRPQVGPVTPEHGRPRHPRRALPARQPLTRSPVRSVTQLPG